MSETKTNTQGNENKNWFEGLLAKRPSLADVQGWLVSFDGKFSHLYAPIAGAAMYFLGLAFTRFLPTAESSPVEFQYFGDVFNGFFLIAATIVGFSLFESLRRNEVKDTFKVLVAIAINYLAITAGGNMAVVSLAYLLGFAIVDEASRHGKLDFTPMVAFHGAFIGIAAHTFGWGGISLVWPVMAAVLYEVVEIFRNKDYQSVRLALPGLVIALVGVIFTMNPTSWVLAGAVVSFIVTPTLVKAYNLKTKKGGSWLKTCNSPCEGWGNSAQHIRINFESVMLTLVGSTLIIVTMMML